MAVEITFERGLRIWWSYTWRTFVMLAPLVILMMYFLPGAFVAPAQTPETAADPMGESQGANPLLLLILLAANIALQVQAMRWMLKTKWRDFRLEAVSHTDTAAPSRTE